MIEFKDVHKQFGEKKVLKGLNFTVDKGDIAVVMGPSGTGKSTVIKHIVGLLNPTSGDILVDGVSVQNCNEKELLELRKKIGFAFQFGALFDSMNIHDNIDFPLIEHTKLTPKQRDKKIDKSLEMVGLKPQEILKNYPHELSGGMQKRVAIARTIILEPDILLYDEPTSGLDPIASDLISRLIVKLRDELGITSIVISHDIQESFKIADQMIMLYDGKVLADDNPEFFKTTSNPIIRQFIDGISEL
ncbi:MAG TPA: ABC transporter ATP-binding protein [Campylobacterales bacterium]|nr:ABC transporter ATP-binding protein [Campylobacterales bacterium]